MNNIEVSDNILKRLNKDREHYQKLIGGGDWSLSRTIKEYIKIIDTMTEKD